MAYQQRSRGRLTRALLLSIVAVLLIALVLASPFGLDAVFAHTGADWRLLSDIGQTYGAISALLAALALAGLTASLLLQAREVRHQREQSARMAHLELLRMAISDRRLLACLGRPEGTTDDELARILYLNLFVSWWQMRWEFGDMSEPNLRTLARTDLFREAAGFKLWQISRDDREPRNRRGRRFLRLLDEEYAAAQARRPEFRPGRTAEARRRRRGIAGIVVVTAVGVLLA
ncbi:DUF6082 family protein, partial [Spirillospora sp. NPDC049652]